MALYIIALEISTEILIEGKEEAISEIEFNESIHPGDEAVNDAEDIIEAALIELISDSESIVLIQELDQCLHYFLVLAVNEMIDTSAQ